MLYAVRGSRSELSYKPKVPLSVNEVSQCPSSNSQLGSLYHHEFIISAFNIDVQSFWPPIIPLSPQRCLPLSGLQEIPLFQMQTETMLVRRVGYSMVALNTVTNTLTQKHHGMRQPALVGLHTPSDMQTLSPFMTHRLISFFPVKLSSPNGTQKFGQEATVYLVSGSGLTGVNGITPTGRPINLQMEKRTKLNLWEAVRAQ